MSDTGVRVIEGEWGYACVQDGAVFIPAVVATAEWPLRRVLAHLHRETRLRRMIFSAVLNSSALTPHLRHVVKEWDEWVPEMQSFSHCIEIDYQPPSSLAGLQTTDIDHAGSPGSDDHQ